MASSNCPVPSSSATPSATPTPSPLGPAAPSNVAAIANSSSQIMITWTDNSNDELGFRVLRGLDGKNFTDLVRLGVGVTSYADTGLMPSTHYYYRVVAFNTDFDSDLSTIADATTLAPTLPVAPSNLAAMAVSSSQINLTWMDNSTDETGFLIQRSLDGTNFSDLSMVGSGVTSYASVGLNPSTTYYYRIQAFNGAGSSAFTSVKSAATLAAATTAPAAPTNLVLTVNSSSQITLSWTDNSSNETGFRIQRSLDGTNFSDLTTTAANVGSYADSGLSAATRYFYKVQSYNLIGPSAYTGVQNATTTAAVPPGKALYDTYCMSCHRLGSYDMSGSAPDLANNTAQQVVNKLNGGHHKNGMTATQINDLANFVILY